MQDLEAGRLLHLMPDCRWPVAWAYFAAAAPKALRRHEVKAFHDWLVHTAHSSSSPQSD